MQRDGDRWIFGYGSLMWRPGFAFEEKRIATIHGYHRSLCVYSHVHRGTQDAPGLVLGLDRGGSCQGVAFRVRAENWDGVIDYLREREQVTSIYLEILLKAKLADGDDVVAVTYVADRTHHQYAGRLERDELLRLVRQGKGMSGDNPAYVINTYDHLHSIGVHDKTLKWLMENLQKTA
jgi:cation transport protein ChaC